MVNNLELCVCVWIIQMLKGCEVKTVCSFFSTTNELMTSRPVCVCVCVCVCNSELTSIGQQSTDSVSLSDDDLFFSPTEGQDFPPSQTHTYLNEDAP